MTKISELTSIVTAAATDIIAVVQGGVTKKATVQDYRDAGIIPTADQATALAAYQAALAAAEAGQVLTSDGAGGTAWESIPAPDLSGYATTGDLSAHTGNTSNPHGVTAAQAGADPAGTAATAVAGHESTYSHPSSAEAAWVTAGKTAVPDAADLVDANDLGTAAYAATGDFDAAGSAAAAQTAAQSYADGLNTAMDGRVDILEAALIPVAIADMAATTASASAINLAWTHTAVAPITGFRIYRKTGAGAYSLIDTANSGDTSYADSGLDASTEYTYRVDAYNTFFQTAGNEDSATTNAIQLADAVTALPGFQALWKFDDTSGTTVTEATGQTSFDGTYAGAIPLAAVALPTAIGGSVANFADSNDNIALWTTALQNAWSWQAGWCMILMKQSAPENKQFVFVDSGYSPTITLAAHTVAGGSGYMRIDAGTAKVVSYYQRYDDWTFMFLTWSVADNQFIGYLNGAPWYTHTYSTAGTTLNANIFMGQGAGYRGALGYFAFGAGSLPSGAEIDALYRRIYPTTYKSVLVVGDSWATDNDYWIDQLVADLRTSTGNHWREAPYRIGYSGQAVGAINTALATDLPARLHTQPDLIVLVAAANDITAGTAEATFKAAFGGILDTLQTNCPDVPVVINFPYRDDAYNGSYDAAALAIKGWMETVIAAKSGTHYTIDGNVWFKTNIDTWSSDRIHPTTEAGFAELVGEIMTAAGY